MQLLRDLARVSVRPRQTIREILDRGRVRLWPIVLLAVCVTMISKVSIPEYRRMPALDARLIAIVITVSALSFLVLAAFFYLAAFAATYAARLLEGTGTYGKSCVAMAYGLAPIIWSLFYRVPFAMLKPAPEVHRFGKFDFSLPAGGVAFSLLDGVMGAIMLAWTLFVMSEALGEAHGISGWRGLGALAIVAAAPFIIGLAAVLALHT